MTAVLLHRSPHPPAPIRQIEMFCSSSNGPDRCGLHFWSAEQLEDLPLELGRERGCEVSIVMSRTFSFVQPFSAEGETQLEGETRALVGSEELVDDDFQFSYEILGSLFPLRLIGVISGLSKCERSRPANGMSEVLGVLNSIERELGLELLFR